MARPAEPGRPGPVRRAGVHGDRRVRRARCAAGQPRRHRARRRDLTAGLGGLRVLGAGRRTSGAVGAAPAGGGAGAGEVVAAARHRGADRCVARRPARHRAAPGLRPVTPHTGRTGGGQSKGVGRPGGARGFVADGTAQAAAVSAAGTGRSRRRPGPAARDRRSPAGSPGTDDGPGCARHATAGRLPGGQASTRSGAGSAGRAHRGGRAAQAASGSRPAARRRDACQRREDAARPGERCGRGRARSSGHGRAALAIRRGRPKGASSAAGRSGCGDQARTGRRCLHRAPAAAARDAACPDVLAPGSEHRLGRRPVRTAPGHGAATRVLTGRPPGQPRCRLGRCSRPAGTARSLRPAGHPCAVRAACAADGPLSCGAHAGPLRVPVHRLSAVRCRAGRARARMAARDGAGPARRVGGPYLAGYSRADRTLRRSAYATDPSRDADSCSGMYSDAVSPAGFPSTSERVLESGRAQGVAARRAHLQRDGPGPPALLGVARRRPQVVRGALGPVRPPPCVAALRRRQVDHGSRRISCCAVRRTDRPASRAARTHGGLRRHRPAAAGHGRWRKRAQPRLVGRVVLS